MTCRAIKAGAAVCEEGLGLMELTMGDDMVESL